MKKNCDTHIVYKKNIKDKIIYFQNSCTIKNERW